MTRCSLQYVRSFLTALWATRMTEETEDNQELRIKTTLRELVVYIIFLIILCIGKTSLLIRIQDTSALFSSLLMLCKSFFPFRFCTQPSSSLESKCKSLHQFDVDYKILSVFHFSL